MRERLVRTVLSVLAVVGAVFAVRWTIRAAMSRAYRAERDVGAAEMPLVPAPRVWSLAEIVPRELRVNIAGLAIRRRAERLHMPYSLAVDIAEEKAKSAGWERLDDENALTIKNLSGMERVYKTPEGSIVLREVRAIRGDDSLMEDFTIPAELVPEESEQTTPDALARRSAQQVKAMMPGVVRDVVAGSPLMTELIERGGGAAFIVHCVAETAAAETARAIEAAARKAGWAETKFDPAARAAALHAASWTKKNLTLHFETVPRLQGGGCDVDYRFTDDEAYILKKGQANEN
jgi:hypothetical protein